MAQKPTGTEAARGAAVQADADGGAEQSAVRWDDSQMVTNFANVVNVQSTREQVDVFFGTNQTWNIADEKRIAVALNNRVILTPFAAKRLLTILGSVLKEYENRYGELKL